MRKPKTTSLWNCEASAEDRTLYRYGVDETQRDRADLRIDPQTSIGCPLPQPAFKDRLPP